jgi:hypothetical protein
MVVVRLLRNLDSMYAPVSGPIVGKLRPGAVLMSTGEESD